MMSASLIREIASKHARMAKRNHVKPYVPKTQEEINAGKFQIPFLGDYVPPEFYLEEELFVDSSGFGSPGEPAMTQDSFLRKMVPGKGYAIREAGQFQVYVGVYGLNSKKTA